MTKKLKKLAKVLDLDTGEVWYGIGHYFVNWVEKNHDLVPDPAKVGEPGYLGTCFTNGGRYKLDYYDMGTH